jgi:hypothetical protein
MMTEMTDREFRTAARELVARVAQMTRFGTPDSDEPVGTETEALLDRMLVESERRLGFPASDPPTTAAEVESRLARAATRMAVGVFVRPGLDPLRN